MRPIKLIIEGVNSFTDRQELDFERVGRSGLFCICGKTGAGKTTIFDCIMLSLYGKTNRGKLSDVVNLARRTAFVSFEFDEDGERYVIERTVKVKTDRGDGASRDLAGTECRLYRNGEPIATTAEEANALASGIIGLSWGEFKNVYMLEQGEYAEFLKKTPAKQSEAVGKIFSLMRFGDVYTRAKEKKALEESAAEALATRIDDLGDVGAERLKEQKAALSAMRAKQTATVKDAEKKRARLDEISKKRDEYISVTEKHKAVKALFCRLDAARHALSDAEQKRAELFETDGFDKDNALLQEKRKARSELAELNALDKEYAATASAAKEKSDAASSLALSAEKLTAELADIDARVDLTYGKLTAAIAEFVAAADKLEKPSAQAVAAIQKSKDAERTFISAAIAETISVLREQKSKYDDLCTEKKKCVERISDKKRELADYLKEIEKCQTETDRLTEKRKIAESAVAAAAEKLAKAQVGSHAAAIIAELKSGDTCPVCGGVFERADGHLSSDVEKCKAEHARLEAELKAVDKQLEGVARLADKCRDDYDRADRDRQEAEKQAAELDTKMTESGVEPEVFAEMSAALGKARKFDEELRATDADKARTEPRVAAVQASLEAATAAAAEAEQKAAELSARLGDSVGKTDAAIAEVDGAISSLEKRVSAVQKARTDAENAVQAAKGAADTLAAEYDAAVAECPVDIPEFDEEAYLSDKAVYEALVKQQAEGERDIALKSAEVDDLTQKAERKKALDAERIEHQKRADRFAVIAEMTKTKAMLNYVAAEYIENFTAIASDILTELSHGKYTMSYNQADGFVVSDFLNNGKPRKTDTLSGGELFLASLSVAIAIARAVGKGNNSFFFLDEGFGTLDDELIDTVYAALEALSRDQLVGVITHADALIDRMPSRVTVVEATDTAGSRIEY